MSITSNNITEQAMFERNAPDTRERLKAARVAVAGLGGLGSNIAAALARLGVGELILIDHDIVEPSNLNRQHYGITHLGMKKTVALSSQLADINPFINIKTADAFITAENAAQLFDGYGIVCEALDDPLTKAMLVSTLLSNSPTVKIVAASGMAGTDSANGIRTRAAMNGRLYVCGDEETAVESGAGMMAPRVLVCAGHQANAVMRLILT